MGFCQHFSKSAQTGTQDIPICHLLSPFYICGQTCYKEHWPNRGTYLFYNYSDLKRIRNCSPAAIIVGKFMDITIRNVSLFVYYHLPPCRVVYHIIIFCISGHCNINVANESGSPLGHSLSLTRGSKGPFL